MTDISVAPIAKFARHSTRFRRWLIFFPVGLIAGGIAALAWWRNAPAKQDAKLDGQLTVLVRPPDRKIEPVPIQQAGALPVVAEGAMCLDAQLNQPAFIYLLWIDSERRVLPLYPWNNETLEVLDANEPPPVRRATRLVFSPLLGRVWTFGNVPGMETIVVLARRTPLPGDVHVGSFFDSLPSTGTGPLSDSLSTIKLGAGPAQVKTVKATGGNAPSEAKTTDGDLLTILDRLRTHFEFIAAAQFPHKASAVSLPAEKPPSEEKN